MRNSKTIEHAPPKRDVRKPGRALTQAELISRSLKTISREARKPAHIWSRFLVDSRGRPIQAFGIGMILSFIALVFIPVLFSALYLAFFTSDQYASEVRFAVRGGQQGDAKMNPIASLTGSASTVRLQDSAIVAEYIKGRGMVDYLERAMNLREKFSGSKADYIFGFNPSRSMERLVNYWWWQIDVDVERTSGIITVIVRAFTPQDALQIARLVTSASEALVNDLSERARTDALKLARQELAFAEKMLQDKIKQMRDLREKQRVLDPTLVSESTTKVLAEMRLELSRMEGEYESNRAAVSESAPQMRVLSARIRAAREQIKATEATLTGQAKDKTVLSETISMFDRLKLEQELAQKHYIAAAAVLEKARVDAEAKELYLAAFLQPVLAEEALYPKRMWILTAILVICLLIWGSGAGIAVLVRNHAA